jgi:hypothetical protein
MLTKDDVTPPNLPQLASEGPLSGSIENRLATRTNVTWRARLLSHEGLMMDVRTADISVSGVGLIGDHPLELHSVMQLAIQVPHFSGPRSFKVITGTIKIVFHVLKGDQYRSGGQWINLAEPDRALLKSWIERVPPLLGS